MENKQELKWNYDSGKIQRAFTKEWGESGMIRVEKIPDMVSSLVANRKAMIEYIELLHNKIDDIIEKNNICDCPSCHIANCTSDHK